MAYKQMEKKPLEFAEERFTLADTASWLYAFCSFSLPLPDCGHDNPGVGRLPVMACGVATRERITLRLAHQCFTASKLNTPLPVGSEFSQGVDTCFSG